jgi:hypothetical protein
MPKVFGDPVLLDSSRSVLAEAFLARASETRGPDYRRSKLPGPRNLQPMQCSPWPNSDSTVGWVCRVSRLGYMSTAGAALVVLPVTARPGANALLS